MELICQTFFPVEYSSAIVHPSSQRKWRNMFGTWDTVKIIFYKMYIFGGFGIQIMHSPSLQLCIAIAKQINVTATCMVNEVSKAFCILISAFQCIEVCERMFNSM